MNNNHKNRNKISHTIGVLIDWVDAPCQNEILSGLNSFSEENDLNLICFSLGRLESSHEWERNRNIILDFVSHERIDGLIVVSVIANLTGITRAEELLSGYSGYPMVSICERFFDKPAVLIDNDKGMRKIMDHIINVHGYRKIAFLKGPQGNMEAQKRFLVYQEMLRLHKIPFREELVIEGDFEVGSGSEAARKLMKNGQDIDVIVSANDVMAMGFLEEIRFRNNGVKFKIPITGFDDTFGGIGTNLTSVRQPFYDMARKAGSLLIDIFEGRPVPTETLIEPEIKVRQSCGCVLSENSIKPFSLPLSLADTLMKLMPDCDNAVLESIMRLHDSFRSEFFSKNETGFIDRLNEIIDSFQDCKKNRFSVLSRAFLIFREFIIGNLTDREELSAAEDLFYKAQNIITDALDHFGLMARMEKDQSFQKINDIGAAISTTLEIDKKMDILYKELPLIGFRFCRIALYEDHDFPLKTSRLIFAYDGDKRYVLGRSGVLFPTRELMPGMYFPGSRNYNIVIHSLYEGSRQIGFFIHNYFSGQGDICEMIRERISSSLNIALLFEKVRYQAFNLEKQVKERTKDLYRINARLKMEINERKQAEELLRESERHFRDMASFLPTIILDTDMDLRFTYVNKTGLELFEIDENDLNPDLSLEMFIMEEERPRFHDYCRRIFLGEARSFNEFRIIKPDGLKITFFIKAVPIFSNNLIKGIRWNAIDIKPLMASAFMPDEFFFKEYRLSEREKDVLFYLLRGQRNKEIAQALFITEGTVKDHIGSIFAKIGVANRDEFFRKMKENQINHFGYQSYIFSVFSQIMRE